MANYIGMGRSNYFKVIDVDKFKRLCDTWDLVYIDHGQDEETVVGFYNDEGGMPFRYDAESGDEHYVEDFIEELAPLLADGHVAIIQEIGYEKMRYFQGIAVAFNNLGKTEWVNFDTLIVEKASALGKHITPCEY